MLSFYLVIFTQHEQKEVHQRDIRRKYTDNLSDAQKKVV